MQNDAQVLKMSEAAQTVGVSVATIRNWVRTGVLEMSGRGLVNKISLQNLIDGKKTLKLRSRANKLYKKSHDHQKLSAEISQSIDVESAEDLARKYESQLSESFRNREGIYYTPADIVTDMLRDLGDVSDKTFLDPCCGSGNFLLQAIAIGFRPENVFGFDTDANAVKISRQRIFEQTGHSSDNIRQADFLKLPPMQFDYIFTNPPWGNKTDRKSRVQIGRKLHAGKSVDTSALFFFACLESLTPGGKLGLLLPESFFSIGCFEDARKTALQYRIERLTDYGRPFKTLLTKASAMILSKTDGESKVRCESSEGMHLRNQSSFANLPKTIFNFTVNDREAELIDHLYSIDHVTLKNNAQWALGIVTGNNSLLLSSKPKPNYRAACRGTDITDGKIAPASVYVAMDKPLQQKAPDRLYAAPEKLIYRFISSRLHFAVDTKERLTLNSANMLVLSPDFPVTHKQLADMLNSDVMNWLFAKIFNTRKVLRGDLEKLPVYADYFKRRREFDEASFRDFLGLTSDGRGGFIQKKSPARARDSEVIA